MSNVTAFKVIGFNKNGSQMMLSFAPTLAKLRVEYAKDIVRHEAMPAYNILPAFTKILVADVDGFTGLELPYVPQVP